MESNRLTIKEAAKAMGISQQFLRVGIQKGIFSFGTAMQLTGNKYVYYINKNHFEEETGIKINKATN